MRTAARCLRAALWIVLVLYIVLQILTMVAIRMGNVAYSLVPLGVVTAAMTASAVLFTVWKKRPYIGLLLAGICGVAMIAVSLDLKTVFPVVVSAAGDIDYGLSTLKMVFRHMGMAVVPLLMLGAWLCQRAADRTDALRRHGLKSTVDLSGERIFKDRG